MAQTKEEFNAKRRVIRAEKRRTGECIHCPEKAIDKSVLCAACLKKSRDATRKSVAKRIEAVLCLHCGKKNDSRGGQVMCTSCRVGYFKERYEERKSKGVCTSCGKRKAKPRKTKCTKCTEKKKMYRERMIENGICLNCGMLNDSEEGQTTCITCREERNVYPVSKRKTYGSRNLR